MSQPGKSETTINTDGNGEVANTQPPATGTTENTNAYGGFATVDELVAAHAALKAEQDAAKAAATTTDTANTDDKSKNGGVATIDENDTTDSEVKDALSAAGLSHEDFSTEYQRDGKLSDESYEKLAKAGYPKAMVDVYVEGLNARSQAYSAAVFGPAGGEKGYTDLVSWAAKNATAAEKTAFNDAVTSGDSARAALAVQAMVAKKNGGSLLNGKANSGDTGVQPFRSSQEMVTAMRDRRYKTDPAFRADVAARLRVSPNF